MGIFDFEQKNMVPSEGVSISNDLTTRLLCRGGASAEVIEEYPADEQAVIKKAHGIIMARLAKKKDDTKTFTPADAEDEAQTLADARVAAKAAREAQLNPPEPKPALEPDPAP